jgi:hypothetical protein
MLFRRTEINQTISTEESLDACIRELTNARNLISCSLHFKANDLPLEKITILKDELISQVNLESLVLTADVSEVSSENYAKILEDSFTSLKYLTVLVFRGLFSDSTVKVLMDLIKETEKLSKLSVGTYYIGQQCKMISESGGYYIAEALRENKTLTILDLQRNRIGKNTQILVANMLKNPHLKDKILNVSNNQNNGDYESAYTFCTPTGALYKDLYNGSGILELINTKYFEEIYVDDFIVTPLQLKCTIADNEQLKNICSYLSIVKTVKHLHLSLQENAQEITVENIKLLAKTIINGVDLTELELNNFPALLFHILCYQGLTKPSNLIALSLRILDLNSESGNLLIQLVENNTHLTSFSFISNTEAEQWISGKFTTRLGTALEFNKNLTSVELEGISFSLETIARIIKYNNCIQTLSLEKCMDQVSAQGTDALLNLIGENKALRRLNLRRNKLTFPENLNDNFLKNTSLVDFILTYNVDLSSDKNIIKGNYLEAIKKTTENNKIQEMIEHYFLIYSLLRRNQNILPKEIINYLCVLFIYKQESNGKDNFEKMQEKISTGREANLITASVDNSPPPKSQDFSASPPTNASFLLNVGVAFAGCGFGMGVVALLGLFGIITISTAGICSLLGSGILFGFLQWGCLFQDSQKEVSQDDRLESTPLFHSICH